MPTFTPNVPIVTETPTIKVEGLPPGQHRFQLVVEDEAGNRSQPDIAVVTVEAAVPVITGIDPPSDRQDTQVEAVITGTNLLGATTVKFTGQGVTGTVMPGGTAQKIPVTIKIQKDAPPGARRFSVTTRAGDATSPPDVVFSVLKDPLILRHERPVFSVAWSPDGRLIATASEERVAHVWDAETGNKVSTLPHGAVRAYSVAWSPDSTLIVTGSEDPVAHIWDARTGRELFRLAHAALRRLFSVAVSPDGRLIATGSQDPVARIWDAQSGREVRGLLHAAAVRSVAWSPDGTQIATGSEDRAAHIWDARTGREVAKLPHEASVLSVAWSPDGTQIATGSEDRAAHIWDVQTSREVRRLPHDASVLSVAWSPDRRRIATASKDTTARIWNA